MNPWVPRLLGRSGGPLRGPPAFDVSVMGNRSFEQFRNFVLRDAALQAALMDIDDRDEFIMRVVELGRRNSFDLDREDVVQAMRDAGRAWIDRWS